MAQVAAAISKAPTKTPPARISRLAIARQVLVSLATVMVGYWLYAFLAVPWIEPGVEDRARSTATQEQIESARGDVTARQREVARYFSPGDWETDKPAIWRSGEMRLLFKNIEPNDDGTVALQPCTLMFFPKDGDGSGPERPVIMRAMEGANIRFDQPVELKSVDLAQRKFVGGRLDGPIRIYRQASAPGAGDDLEITTSDIKMAGQRAWTPQKVNFRFGRSTGSGRELEILLGSADGRPQADMMRGATFRSLKLMRDVQMLLELAGPTEGTGAGGPPAQAEPPIKITCQGPFVFAMESYAASFHDQVDVLRLNPSGEGDQLNCALLTVFFSRPGAVEPGGRKPPVEKSGSQNTRLASQVRLIEARGDPVTMRRPSQGMYARCHGVDFVPAAPGSNAAPGSLAAFGPGVIVGNLPDDPTGNFVAQWARELRFEPDGSLQRATLRGAIDLQIGQMGKITADEVFAWLSRKPAAPQRSGAGAETAAAWQIERVLAQRYQDSKYQSQGDVVIDSQQLHATAAKLEATIDRPQPGPAGPPGVANGQGAPPKRAAAANQQNPNERFEVSGDSVHIRLVPEGEQMAIAGATIERDAELKQFAIAGESKVRSLWVKGDRLHVAGANTEDTTVAISGHPAYVEAAGMTLWGTVINLAKRSSRLWIDGSGQLTMPITQDFDGKALAIPQKLSVDWTKGMNFQSNTAVFEGRVVARSQQQVLKTGRLEAVLSGNVDFSNPSTAVGGGGKNAGPELAEVRTRGPTFLESRQIDDQGQQTSHSQMDVADLSVNRTTGQIAGRGPGWIKHIARGAPPQVNVAGQPPPKEKAAAAPPEDQFTFVYVTFRQGIDGNINRRQIKLFNRTRTVVGPVADWNEELKINDLAALGPQGMVLEADTLEIREMNPRPDSQRGWFELDGSGGVFAEGQRFTALGDRLTYAEEKDQLILRGNPAEMYLENESGGPRNETRVNKVSYWLTQHHLSISGARDLNLVLPGNQQRKPKKAPPNPPAAARR